MDNYIVAYHGRRFMVQVVLLVGSLAVITSSGCKQSPVQSTNASIEDDIASNSQAHFVGSSACARCHEVISKNYASHPMAQSTRPVEMDHWGSDSSNLPANVMGTRRVLTASQQGTSVVHSEQMYDETGELIYEQPHRMKYVVGSGSRARAYLEQRDDRLFMSPLNWYQSTQSWGLAPGYHTDDVRRFDRKANDECLNCHTGRVEMIGPEEHLSHPQIAEASIGCERCHGPGSTHIEFHSSPAKASVEDPIKNPSKFTQFQQESLCYQCHLTAAARLLRPGKKPSDFQPGMRVSDIWAILDLGSEVTNSNRTRSTNHVQQMRDSRCFRESVDRMTCTSCHDPHQKPDSEQQIEFYRNRCLNCHQLESCTEQKNTRLESEDDCTKCHMPKLEASNMAHVAQTDHRILKSRNVKTDSPADLLQFFADTARELNDEERQRSLALGAYIHCTKKGIVIPQEVRDALNHALENYPDDAAILVALAVVSLERNETSVSRNLYDRASKVDPNDEAALDGLLEATYVLGDWPACINSATRLLALDSSNVRALAYRGDAYARLGENELAIADLKNAAELNPGEPMFRKWLVDKCMELKQTANAQTHRTLLNRINGAKLPIKPRTGDVGQDD